jgi:hypothetical protein
MWGWYNRPIMGAVPSGLSFTPIIIIIIIIIIQLHQAALADGVLMLCRLQRR